MGKTKCIKNFRCEICNSLGMLQILTPSYARIRHYDKLVDGKPRFIYHRNSTEYVKQILEKRQNSLAPKNIDQERNYCDLNLQDNASNNENRRAGSSVWHERLIRNQEVAGSNPARSTSL